MTAGVYLAGIPIADRSLFRTYCTIPASTPVPDQDLDPITLASRKFTGKLTVEFENLRSNTAANATVVKYAETLGTMPAYMTNNYFSLADPPGGTACSGGIKNPGQCTPAEYLSMLETGISPDAKDTSLHSQFLEIFYTDINGSQCTVTNPQLGCGYPKEIEQAQHDLLGPPVLDIAFPSASSSTMWWYAAFPLDGSVTVDSTTGQKIDALQCTGAASGAGASGFNLDVKHDGNPALIKCTATDSAANTGESIRALWIDTLPPVTTVSVRRLTLTGTVNLTFSATDTGVGVAETDYSLDNGASWTAANTLILSSPGTYTVLYRSIDLLGHVEKTQSLTVQVTAGTGPPGCKGRTCV